VQEPIDPKRNIALIDLGMLRETLDFIRSDLERVTGLERASELLAAAASEIAAVERQRLPIPRSILASRPPPRRRH